MYSIVFPALDPVLVEVGPFAIRWYALAYIAGIVIGWRIMLWLSERPGAKFSRKDADDSLLWMTVGIILGGRLGYVLFYKPLDYIARPLEILQVWQGGMAFHGGLLGVIAAIILFTRRRKISTLAFGDALALVAPIGLFFGRLANFINGELWGRVTDVPWGVVFCNERIMRLHEGFCPAGDVPRHPSQLYQAAMEGLVLLAVLWWLRNKPAAQREGFLCGVFLVGYGLARIVGEFFRQPDQHLGFLFAGATMGQLLSLPLVIAGLLLLRHALRARAA
jgi:phosphatidylglycerol:prolipoprotein diacylglycerol transferase